MGVMGSRSSGLRMHGLLITAYAAVAWSTASGSYLSEPRLDLAPWIEAEAGPIELPTHTTEPTCIVKQSIEFGGPSASDFVFLSVAGVEERGTGSVDPIDELVESEAEEPPVNYRGELVPAAPSGRYVEDFEDGAVGEEWGSGSEIEADEKLGKFARVARGGAGKSLNIKTRTAQTYEAQIQVILFPPASDAEPGSGADDENIITISVDGRPVLSFSPSEFRRLRGPAAVRGWALVRTIRLPFIASHRVSEVTITAAEAPEGASWSDWAIDNVVVDIGQIDAVLGVAGGDFGFEPGVLGFPGYRAGLTGELPGSRFARNGADFAGTNGRGGGGGRPVPSPGAPVLFGLCAAVAMARRRDESL